MTFRVAFAMVALSGFALSVLSLATGPARGQDGAAAEDEQMDGEAFFEEFMAEIEKDKADQARCRNKDKAVSATEQVTACTRLIEGAPHENDVVGHYYIDRALAQTDTAMRCADIRKGRVILENWDDDGSEQTLIESTQQFEETVCQ